jgi:recombinational DNA repair protein RecR
VGKGAVVIVTIDPRQMASLKAVIENTGRNLRKELVIATNQTARKTQGVIAKQLAAKLNLKQKVSKRGVRVTRTASGQDISATVEVNKDKRFNLTAFIGTKQAATGVSLQDDAQGEQKGSEGFVRGGEVGRPDV